MGPPQAGSGKGAGRLRTYSLEALRGTHVARTGEIGAVRGCCQTAPFLRGCAAIEALTGEEARRHLAMRQGGWGLLRRC